MRSVPRYVASILVVLVAFSTSDTSEASGERIGAVVGWTRIAAGGDTRCSDGSPYTFFVHSGDSLRVLLYFGGGGLCWNGVNCFEQPTHRPRVTADSTPGSDGIFDITNPENPFSSYTIVFAPYCTGDLHLGARDQQYPATLRDGTTGAVEVHHRGLTNALAVLDWLTAIVPNPTRIGVMGESAGGFAVPFYGSLLAQRYPRSRVWAVIDGIGMWDLMSTPSASANWGLPETLRHYEGWQTFPGDWSIPDLFATASHSAPRLQLFLINQAWDQGQGTWVVRLGGSAANLPSLLRLNREQIASTVPSFRVFTLGGMFHTILSEPYFYSHGADGVRLRDWVAEIEAEDPVASVECSKCWRPDIQFQEEHLRVVDSAIAILSASSRWNSADVGSCPSQPSTWSLRCAFFQAGGDSPTATAAYHELFYTALERLGGSIPPTDPARPFNPIRLINDRQDTKAADMLELLREVRHRIVLGLSIRSPGIAPSPESGPP